MKSERLLEVWNYNEDSNPCSQTQPTVKGYQKVHTVASVWEEDGFQGGDVLFQMF